MIAIGDKNVIAIENKIKSGINGIDKYNELSQLITNIEHIEEKYPKKKRYFQIYSFMKGNVSLLQNNRYAEDSIYSPYIHIMTMRQMVERRFLEAIQNQ